VKRDCSMGKALMLRCAVAAAVVVGGVAVGGTLRSKIPNYFVDGCGGLMYITYISKNIFNT